MSIDPISDEIAAQTIAGRAAGIGGIVWPSEVEAEIARVDGIANATDATMQKCYAPTDAKRLAWAATLSSWRAAVQEAKSSAGWSPWFGPFAGYFGRGGQYDLAQEFERKFVAFADQARADGCAGAPSGKARGDREAEQSDNIASAVKFAAVGVVAVAAVIAIKSVI